MTKRSKRLPLILLVLLAFSAACMVAGLLAYNWYYQNFLIPPGEGPKAEAGYQACQPLIEALAAYQAKEGRYPQALSELVPGYLVEIPAQVNEMELIYRLTEQSYSLEFSYAGPGMNHCAYTPEAGWDCSGFW